MNKVDADIILRGGTFYTGVGNGEDYDWIAIKGNKIMDLGKGDKYKAHIGDETREISFSKENLIMPGIHDNHIHLIQSGMLDKYIDLSETKSEEEAAKLVDDFARANPEGKWIIGFGWSKFAWDENRLPSRKSLDKYIEDRPVFLLDSELHGVWVNGKALEVSKITKETKDPPYGKIERGEDKEPTGFLYEKALSLAGKYALDFEEKEVENLILRYMEKALRWGITSASDMTPYLGLDLAFEEVYLKMAKTNQLKLRVYAAKDLLGDIEENKKLKERAEKEGHGMYKVPYLKQFIDGVIGNYTAYLLDRYNDRENERGGLLLEEKELFEKVEEAQRAGFSVRLHACGDGAVKMALDAYCKAEQQNPEKSCRHQIEHIEVIAKEDIKRFKELGVIASIQAEHIVSGMPSFSDNTYPKQLGKEREAYTWAFRSLKNAGAILAGGSDSPVVEGNPFLGMECGLKRMHEDGTPAGGWNPKEKLTIDEMIEMYTSGAAFAEGLEESLGQLKVGMLADIIVLNKNLFEQEGNLGDTLSNLTIVDGIIRYEREN